MSDGDGQTENLKEATENKLILKAVDRIATYLASRDHSVRELRTKLQRHFEPKVIEQALAIAGEYNWLADPMTLAVQIQEQLYRRGKGHNYIVNQLRKKGLPEVSLQSDLEAETAARVLNSKYPNWQSFDSKQIGKAYRFLLSRGFTPSIVFELKKNSFQD